MARTQPHAEKKQNRNWCCASFAACAFIFSVGLDWQQVVIVEDLVTTEGFHAETEGARNESRVSLVRPAVPSRGTAANATSATGTGSYAHAISPSSKASSVAPAIPEPSSRAHPNPIPAPSLAKTPSSSVPISKPVPPTNSIAFEDAVRRFWSSSPASPEPSSRAPPHLKPLPSLAKIPSSSVPLSNPVPPTTSIALANPEPSSRAPPHRTPVPSLAETPSSIVPISKPVPPKNSNHLSTYRPTVWEGSLALGSDGQNQCKMVNMSPIGLDGGTAPRMCVRHQKDLISLEIEKTGFWSDCPPLAELWKMLPDRSSEYQMGNPSFRNKQETEGKLFVDIGANIGACVMQMAARADVPHVVAFEPSPANLFYLTNSLLTNQTLSQKCSLYSDALGSKIAEHRIYAAQGNAGHTMLDRKGGVDVGGVMTITLDDIFMPNDQPPYIHLMKIDTEGYEAKVLQGGKRLFTSGAVNAVRFEFSPAMLILQGSSATEYINLWLRYSFDIYRAYKKWNVTREPLTDKELRVFGCSKADGETNLVAIWQKVPKQNRSRIVC